MNYMEIAVLSIINYHDPSIYEAETELELEHRQFHDTMSSPLSAQDGAPASTNHEHALQPSITRETKEDKEIVNLDVERVDSDVGDVREIDFFSPMPFHPKLPVETGNVLTIRVVLVGWLLGAIVNAGNVYLGKFNRRFFLGN